MYTCDKHDNCVIVFDVYECPICELEAELQTTKDDLEDCYNEVASLENELASLKED